jgi:competence protein ComEA
MNTKQVVGSGLAARARAMVADSAWAGLAGKGAAYLGAFALLAMVGSGRLSTWLSPPGRLAVGVAEAATAAPVSGGSAPLAPAGLPAPAATASAAADAGAPAADAGEAESADAGAPSAGVGADGKVILNLATEEDLRRLPGVGATRARAILTLRARLKRFGRVEDLLKVKGFGRRSVARLRPMVRLD